MAEERDWHEWAKSDKYCPTCTRKLVKLEEFTWKCERCKDKITLVDTDNPEFPEFPKLLHIEALESLGKKE